MVAASVLGAIGSIGGSLINTGLQFETEARNRATQLQINRENIAAQERINSQNLDYMRSMTQAQWERDDNAYQRQVADLEKAGLSPLAATSGGAGNSQSVTSPNLQAAQQYPYISHAPQFDINALINSATKFSDMYEKHNENLSKQNYRTTSLNQKTTNLQILQDRLNADIQYRNSKLSQENTHFIQSFQLQQDIFEHTKNKDLSEIEIKKFCSQSQATYNAINSQLPDKNLPHKVFYIKNKDDLDLYETHYQIYIDSFQRYLNDVEHSAQYKANASSQARGGNGGISFAGNGANIGANVLNSEYSAESKDKNQLFDESWTAYCMKNKIYYPIPMYQWSLH